MIAWKYTGECDYSSHGCSFVFLPKYKGCFGLPFAFLPKHKASLNSGATFLTRYSACLKLPQQKITSSHFFDTCCSHASLSFTGSGHARKSSGYGEISAKRFVMYSPPY